MRDKQTFTLTLQGSIFYINNFVKILEVYREY